ncbi:MAG: 30S ribosomal protein S12 methylthiotransferase RimO [Moorellales bacterium]
MPVLPYRVALISLGCPKNQVDSEVMLARLAQAGYQPTDQIPAADVIIVNTCGFIEAAKRESIEATLEALSSRKPGAKLILAGCLAQGWGEELAQELPEVEAVVGPGLVGEIVSVVEEVLGGRRLLARQPAGDWEHQVLPRLLSGNRGSAYLKIAEGCSHRCSFCVIPRLRGPYRSRPEEVILEEAAQLAACGAKELVLVAQDTASWGIDRYGEFRLPRLLRRLAGLPEVRWLRLLYLYPTHVRPELLAVMAEEEKVCRYFDLPFQHASPRMLSLMGRPQVERHWALLEQIRGLMPDAVLRGTFIVGFPGETEEDFTELLSFVQKTEFDWVGAFTFSPEEGTPAAGLPGAVPEEVKQKRWERLMRLQQAITGRRLASWVGRRVEVLVEGKRGTEIWCGRSRGQAPEIDGAVWLRGKAAVGEIVTVTITGVRGYDLLGRVV